MPYSNELKSTFYNTLDYTCYEDVFPSNSSKQVFHTEPFSTSFSETLYPNQANNSPPLSPLCFSDSDTPNNQLMADSPCSQFLGSPYQDPSFIINDAWTSELLFGKVQVSTPKKKKIHTCPYCNHTSNRANNMREHTLIHNPNRPKPFCCTLCDRAFARKHDMKRHVISCKKRSERR